MEELLQVNRILKKKHIIITSLFCHKGGGIKRPRKTQGEGPAGRGIGSTSGAPGGNGVGRGKKSAAKELPGPSSSLVVRSQNINFLKYDFNCLILKCRSALVETIILITIVTKKIQQSPCLMMKRDSYH